MNKTTSVAELLRNFRPAIHFAAQKNWINDPNGLIFYDNEWHLFFQYNPYGNEWGNMNWGHAVSKDLLVWNELGIAIPEDDEDMIFSGSCVIDWNNTSGFSDGEKPPMIAIYTAHSKSSELQTQCIAYSLDNGRSFTKYVGNPVLNIDKADFRDPKVFWNDAQKSWIMIVANSKDNSVSFYSSPNLKNWKFLSEFGNCGAQGHLWECPDIFELSDENGDTRWVLKVDVFSFEDRPQSICQYFIGDFDGAKFTPDCDEHGNPLWGFADFGHDFYAAVSFSDIPIAQGRRIWLGWMNSHHYAIDTPTSPWRGSMTIPRELGLFKTKYGHKLIQSPIAEAFKTTSPTNFYQALSLEKPLIFDAKAIPKNDFEIIIHFDTDERFSFYFDSKSQSFRIDRSKAFVATKIPEIANIATTQRISTSPEIQLQIIVDRFSVELFVDGGIQVFSELCFAISDRVQFKYQPHIHDVQLRVIEIE